MTAAPRAAAASLFVLAWLSVALGSETSGLESREAGHFRFEFHPGQAKVAESLARVAETERTGHCRLLDRCFDGKVTVRIAESEEEFLAWQPYRAHIDWASGVAYDELSLIILRVDKTMLLSIEDTFSHELSHVLLLKAVKKEPPRWFVEGMAILQSRENLIERFETLAEATVTDSVFPLAELAEHFPATEKGRALAYAESGLFLSFLQNRMGAEELRKLLAGLAWGTDFDAAFGKAYGRPVAEVETEWRKTLSGMTWLKGLSDSWMFWTFAALLFVAGVIVKRRRNRIKKARLEAMDSKEPDWEFRDGNRP